MRVTNTVAIQTVIIVGEIWTEYLQNTSQIRCQLSQIAGFEKTLLIPVLFRYDILNFIITFKRDTLSNEDQTMRRQHGGRRNIYVTKWQETFLEFNTLLISL
jgi:hypothetical protein